MKLIFNWKFAVMLSISLLTKKKNPIWNVIW